MAAAALVPASPASQLTALLSHAEAENMQPGAANAAIATTLHTKQEEFQRDAAAVKAGNRVAFDSDGSHIESKDSGERMWMSEDKGMYMLRLWVRTGF